MPVTKSTLGNRTVRLEMTHDALATIQEQFEILAQQMPHTYCKGDCDVTTAYRQTLRMDRAYRSWAEFVAADRSRDGYSLVKRFRGWAASSPFPAVLFWDTSHNEAVKVIHVDEETKQAIVLGYDGLYKRKLTEIFPIFPSKLRRMTSNQARHIQDAQSVINRVTKNIEHISTKPDTEVSGENTTANTTKTKETKMKNINKKAANLLQVEKDAAVQTGYLTAGRTSNKLVKEAVRPILNLIFKPNFMQRLAIKWGGVKNPVDSFMESPASDVVCSRLFRVLLELKGVEDEHVLNAANAAIVYSNLKVGEEIPIEDLIDSAIESVKEGVESLDIAEKVKGKLK